MPKAKSWTRIKGGIYDKDLAFVEKVLGEDKIWVKLIPRLDLSGYKNGQGKFMKRPPARPFN